MRRTSKSSTATKPKLKLNREMIRPLDDDALHQVVGGAGSRTSHLPVQNFK
jgi:hypothetical protein